MFPLYSFKVRIYSLPGISCFVSFSGVLIESIFSRKHFSFNQKRIRSGYIRTIINQGDAITKIHYGRKEKVW